MNTNAFFINRTCSEQNSDGTWLREKSMINFDTFYVVDAEYPNNSGLIVNVSN